MNTSPQINIILRAIFSATRDLEPVVKSRFAKEGDRNYSYATLSDIMGIVCPELFKYNLMVTSSVISVTTLVQPTAEDPRNHIRVRLVMRIFHTSGQWIENNVEADAIDFHSHAVSAATTKARRIAIIALLNLQTIDEVEASVGVPSRSSRTDPLTDDATLIRMDTLQTAKRLIERAQQEKVLTPETLKAMVRKRSDGKFDTLALLDLAEIQSVMGEISKLMTGATAMH